MNPEELFAANLPLVDRVVAGVCRRAGLRDADAEDFASMVTIALMENDYAIVRAWEQRSSLGTYLTIVAQRILSRERTRMWGRWHASAEAERCGAASVLLEKLLLRDRRALEEAIPIVQALEPSLDRRAVHDLASRLPARAPRPRLVSLPAGAEGLASSEQADAGAREADARKLSERAARVVRETLAALPLEDRMLVRFHFGAGLSVAEASRMLGVPQRPLYRRMEALLRQLRDALERDGIGAAAVDDLVSAAAAEAIDLGLHGKNGPARHTNGAEERD